MKNNATTQEAIGMKFKVDNAKEKIDMMQRKDDGGSLIAWADGIPKVDEDKDPVSVLRARIKAKIKELEEKEKSLGVEEEKIMECIKATLDEHDVKYSYDLDRAKMIEVGFGTDNKVFRIMIILQNKKVIYRLAFPCRVQCNTLALVALYMAEFNENKAFSHMNLDLEDGEAAMEYSYFLDKVEDFKTEHFWIYLMALVQSAQEAYTRLNHLAVGKVSKEIKTLYKTLLEQSLAVINGEDDDEDAVIYGCENLQKGKKYKEEFFRKLMSSRNSLEEMENVDEDDDENDAFSIAGLGDESTKSHGIPRYEEFMKMRESGNLFDTSKDGNTSNGSDEEMILPFDDTDEDDELNATGTVE